MSPRSRRTPSPPRADLRLPATLLARYLFFLSRRPISKSNLHYLNRRIAGLKSLAPLLEGSAIAEPAEAIRRLTPANLQRLHSGLTQSLAPWVETELPEDVVVSDQPPPPSFLRGARRLLLILGPAIGIGDEIIAFSIPAWLRRTLPDCHITVLSAYDDLWLRVRQADEVRSYRDYSDIVAALRGQLPGGAFDLVWLVDFEKPSLLQSICFEPAIERYVELAMGARSIYAYDGERRCVYRREEPGPYFANYYYNLCHLLRWLGPHDAPSLEDRQALIDDRQAPAADGDLTVMVSPFSSKHDPSEAYWSQLLASIVPRQPTRALRFVFDPGPNLSTERFATALARATAGRVVRSSAVVQCELVRGGEAGGLSLNGVFGAMERAHALICADSFSAHAGPVFGCTTLVLAQEGLDSWRVPETPSFYFDVRDPLPTIAAGMRQVLESLPEAREATTTLWVPAPAKRLAKATEQLSRGLAAGMNGGTAEAYDELFKAYRVVAAALPEWPEAFAGLFTDNAYDRLLPPLPSRRSDDESLTLHIRDKLESWRNSNLWKYLRLVAPHGSEPRQSGSGRVAAGKDEAI